MVVFADHLIRAWYGGLGLVARCPEWVPVLCARVGIAGIFWRSGRTKVDGWSVTDQTIFLFREEYRLPLLSAEMAAYMAAWAEHILPVLLVLGLATRVGALGLLGMTLIIQVFVYPNLWPDHATWAAALLLIIMRGPGPVSIDHGLSCYFFRRIHDEP
ncbi:DoxX family protein [Haematospirillum sp. H1815]|uniref:DoxX family protein n=1 Tax=Haematospirillum sp. H1815 TaxID=2723108 RepID=UPI00143AC325|nr:DoxX family protein [Haematospirillum sp. H1815]NKD76221.1 DoxX family protein [Haematospirillum sp. H1815]